MARVAFLGLGQMGAPMAGRLLQAGHGLTVWDLVPGSGAALVLRGAELAPSPAAACLGADFIITMLPDPEALESVAFGAAGIAPSLTPGQTVVEMSTVGPAAARSLRARLAPIATVDAPVLGSVPEAEAGQLSIFVGGSSADFELVRPVLESLGRPRHVGGPGIGAATKLAVNVTIVAAMAVIGEALAIGGALGVSREVLLDSLVDSPLGGLAKRKRALIEAGEFPPQFKLRLAAKDIRLVDSAATSAGLRTPVTGAVHQWLEEAERAGAGGLDFAALVALICQEGPFGPKVAGDAGA